MPSDDSSWAAQTIASRAFPRRPRRPPRQRRRQRVGALVAVPHPGRARRAQESLPLRRRHLLVRPCPASPRHQPRARAARPPSKAVENNQLLPRRLSHTPTRRQASQTTDPRRRCLLRVQRTLTGAASPSLSACRGERTGAPHLSPVPRQLLPRRLSHTPTRRQASQTTDPRRRCLLRVQRTLTGAASPSLSACRGERTGAPHLSPVPRQLLPRRLSHTPTRSNSSTVDDKLSTDKDKD